MIRQAGSAIEKNRTALEGRFRTVLALSQICGLGMPGPREHGKSQSAQAVKKRCEPKPHRQRVNLAESREVTGSEAGLSASS